MGWGSAKGAIGGESMERKWNSSEDFILLNGVLDSLCCRYHVKQVVIYDNLVCIGRVKRVKKGDSSLSPHPLLVIDFLGALSIPPLPPRPTPFYDALFQQKQQNTASPSAKKYLRFCRKFFPISEKAAPWFKLIFSNSFGHFRKLQ